jgi:uncharacterized protein (TIGR03083 family)
MTDSPDYASAYRELRTRVSDLVRSADPAALDATAPATPAWRVRDVVAHMAGVCDDVAHGNMEGVASDAWTDAQVAKRADWSMEQVLDDWAEHSAQVEAVMNDLGPAIGQMLADAATHEQDIRGALGVVGERESPAGAIGIDWALPIIGMRLQSEGLGTLRIEHEDGTEVLGEGEPVTTLRTTRFELSRAMTGRRSEAQMRNMDWDGPLDRNVLNLNTTLFNPPTSDLIE